MDTGTMSYDVWHQDAVVDPLAPVGCKVRPQWIMMLDQIEMFRRVMCQSNIPVNASRTILLRQSMLFTSPVSGFDLVADRCVEVHRQQTSNHWILWTQNRLIC